MHIIPPASYKGYGCLNSSDSFALIIVPALELPPGYTSVCDIDALIYMNIKLWKYSILHVHPLTCICNSFSIWLVYSLEETREELEEFQISSRELECELEAQLEQLESKNKDLLSETSKLGSENSSLKVEYCSFLIEYHIIIINYWNTTS